MPIVPKYQPGQERQSVAPGVTSTPAAFGAGNAALLGQAAQALQPVAGAFIQQGIRSQIRTDNAAVRDALSSASNDSMDFISTNVLPKKGQEAIDIVKPTQDALGKIKEKYRKGLSTPAMQEMFDAHFDSTFQHGSNIARSHQLREQEQYQRESLSASNASSAKLANTDPLNHEVVTQSEHDIAANNNVLYHGYPERAKMATAVEISKMHSDNVDILGRNDSALALQYLTKYKSRFTPEAYAKLTDKMRYQLVVEGSDRQVSVLSGIDEPTAMAQAQKIQDPKMRDLTIEGLKAHYAAKNNATARAAADNGAALTENLIQSPLGAALIIPKSYPLEDRKALIAAANQRSQGPVTTDIIVYGDLLQQAKNDPDGFLRRDLTKHLNDLSDEDWKNILKVRDDMSKKRKDAAAPNAFELESIHSQFEDATKGVPGLGLRMQKGEYVDENGDTLKGDKLEARKKQINDFRSEFQNRVNTELPEKKDRTRENINKILMDMTTQVVVQKGWGSWGLVAFPFGAGVQAAFSGRPMRDKVVPKGIVDTNPSIDPSIPSQIRGLPNVRKQVMGGKTLYFQYNPDRTAADVFDGNGKKVGTWPDDYAR